MAKNILCVDDSVTMQKVAEITFDASEFTFHGARNADDGLAAAKANKPDLILVDAVMPGKTGYDLCQAVKGDPSLADVPVLIMCGNSQAYDAARGDGVGADGHVVKPWDTQVMLDKVAEVLESGAKPAAAAAPKPIAAASSAPMPKPPAPPAPPPLSPKPAIPSLNQPEPPRSATIMGMPSLKLPGQPGADFGAAEPTKPPAPPATPAALRPSPPPPAPPAPPRLAMPEPIKPPAPVKPPTPIKPPAPVAVKPPAPIAPLAAAAPAAPAVPQMPRPPMIKGTPSRRPASITALDSGAVSMEVSTPAPLGGAPLAPEAAVEPPRAPIFARASAAAAEVAEAAGIDPNSPEMAAITKLSRDVVERVVWEVVPELAEAIIREHIAKNGIS